MITCTPRADSVQRMNEFFDALKDKLLMLPGVLTYVAQDAVVDEITANFDDESLQGVKWIELADRTIAERIALGFPGEHPILYRTGALFMSLTTDAVVERTENGQGDAHLAMGTNDERFEELQTGGGRPELPPRPMVPDNRVSKIILCTTIEEQCVRLIEGQMREVMHA